MVHSDVKAAPVTGTTLRFTGPVSADSQQLLLLMMIHTFSVLSLHLKKLR